MVLIKALKHIYPLRQEGALSCHIDSSYLGDDQGYTGLVEVARCNIQLKLKSV